MVSSYVSNDQWRSGERFGDRIRMEWPTFLMLCEKLAPLVGDSVNPLTGSVRMPAAMKVGVALFYLGNGGSFDHCGDMVGIGSSTCKKYVRLVCGAVISLMKFHYMPGTPHRGQLARIRALFGARRGIYGPICACDGTHVPWQPDDARMREDYHNYKGWYSLSCMMFVNSYYLFVDGEVGHPGRASDQTILGNSWLVTQFRAFADSWFGLSHDGRNTGFLIGDGGFARNDILMIPMSSTLCNRDVYFNFCFSSTRFFIEQAFGMWKNKFRVLIRAAMVDHGLMCLVIYSSMILHNFIRIHDSAGWAVVLQSAEYPAANSFADVVELWMATNPAAMCAHCRANGASLCTHTDALISELEYMDHDGAADPAGAAWAAASAANRADAMWNMRESVADDLWAAFMQEHPGWNGVLGDVIANMVPDPVVQLGNDPPGL